MAVNVANVIMGVVIAVTVTFIAIMMGGVISGQIHSVFTTLDYNSTTKLINSTWGTLVNTAESYGTTAINIALIGILLAGIFAVLGVVFAFFGRGE